MPQFTLNQILSFNIKDGHPVSKIIGVDSYTFHAHDTGIRTWKSYTLVPINPSERKGSYKRWYIVDLPLLGLSFVRVINENDLPQSLHKEPKLCGIATITTQGDGDLGTGTSEIWTYWDKSTDHPEMYAKETFEDGSTLYFKTNALSADITTKI